MDTRHSADGVVPAIEGLDTQIGTARSSQSRLILPLSRTA